MWLGLCAAHLFGSQQAVNIAHFLRDLFVAVFTILRRCNNFHCLLAQLALMVVDDYDPARSYNSRMAIEESVGQSFETDETDAQL